MEDDDDDKDMPKLQIVFDSEDDLEGEDDNEGSIWFTDVKNEAGSGWESEGLSGVDWSKSSSFIDVDLDLEAAEVDEFAAQVEAKNSDIP